MTGRQRLPPKLSTLLAPMRLRREWDYQPAWHQWKYVQNGTIMVSSMFNVRIVQSQTIFYNKGPHLFVGRLIICFLVVYFMNLLVSARRLCIQRDAWPRTSAAIEGGWSIRIPDWMRKPSKTAQRRVSHKMHRRRKENQVEKSKATPTRAMPA